MSKSNQASIMEMFARKKRGECPFCRKDMNDPDNTRFDDEKSAKEFRQSGLCQDCQDKFFDGGSTNEL